MKKTLAVLMAALLSVACFAMMGSAAEIKTITQNTEDYTGVTANKDLDSLWDGETLADKTDWAAGDYSKAVLFMNADAKDASKTNTIALVVDLGEAKDVSGITVYFYKEYVSMVGLGVENTMTISYSNDGETFTKINDFKFDSEPCTVDADDPTSAVDTTIIGVTEEKFEFGSTINARYLELRLPFSAAPGLDKVENDPKVNWEFVGMTEITVQDGDAADTSEPADESKDESVNESATESADASATSSSTSSATDSSTPSTGDAGVIAVVVLAVAAVIGAAVIVKKRA